MGQMLFGEVKGLLTCLKGLSWVLIELLESCMFLGELKGSVGG